MAQPGLRTLFVTFLLCVSCSAKDPSGCLRADPSQVFRDTCTEPFVVPARAGAPKVLFFEAFPTSLQLEGLLKNLSARMTALGAESEWIGAGSPAYGLLQAEAELPALLARYHPTTVIIFFSQSRILNEQMFRESRRLPPVLRTLEYERSKIRAFGSAAIPSTKLGGLMMDYLLNELNRLRKLVEDSGARPIFLVDGQALQVPELGRAGPYYSSLGFLTQARLKPRALRSMELLPLVARRTGLDLHVSYTLGAVLSSPHPDSAFASTLISAELSTRLHP